MRKDRLLAAAAAIVKNPNDFDMGSWHERRGLLHCKHCIAGWIEALYTTNRFDQLTGGRFLYLSSMELEHVAELIELPWALARPLFYQDQWPTYFRRAYDEAESPLGRAYWASRRIEAFVASYEDTLHTAEADVEADTLDV